MARAGVRSGKSVLVLERRDPMLPLSVLQPSLSQVPDHLEVRWLDRGGHVGFPDPVDLGMDAPATVESQVLAWLMSHEVAG